MPVSSLRFAPRASLLLSALLALGCNAAKGDFPGAVDAGPRTDGSATDGGGRDGGGMDASSGCTGDTDCDDGFECTIDLCEVGGHCTHMGLDSRCASGERCTTSRGCSTNQCETPADCDDHVFCNGIERCVGSMCFAAAAPESCDDGNDCTIDRCDTAMNQCVREFGPGCGPDGGTSDAGAPFDPTMDYRGNFYLAPTQSAECPVCHFNISTISFSVSGGTLTVTASPFVMTQSPAPTGADFSVSGSTSCGSVTLSGMFTDSAGFVARWVGSYGPGCGNPDVTVAGSRI